MGRRLRNLVAAVATALALGGVATPAMATDTQSTANSRVINILVNQAHVSERDVSYLVKQLKSSLLYDTEAHLLADSPDAGMIAYAIDSGVFYLRVGSTWVLTHQSTSVAVTTTPTVLTVAQSGALVTVAATADAASVITLPAVPRAGTNYCVVLTASSLGSNREIDLEPVGASDFIIGTTNAAGATGIATTAGPGHGTKNTHATAVRGNGICVKFDGVHTWAQTSLTGTWAAY